MKKTLVILLSAIIGGSVLVGCGNSGATVKEPQKQEQTKEIKNTIPEMKLGEPFEVKTEIGDYTITINSIKTTEERNEFSEDKPKQVILIDYQYENKSFKNSDGQKLYIDEYAFVVMDGEGNVLRPYPSNMDKAPQAVPVGGKCTAEIAYGVPTDSNTIRLQFERQNKPVGEMVVDIK
ncbi:DUF4352 domain-containing protein [Clostridium perfringens]|uniref:DUF4352 domain-containing protein n=1 Tax=Clostridium perfringens TaxID=1502 RepID=UPI0010945582|nr:DUF4352 domain-containing protein [Clostridium perfringens]TGY43198.1 DUF4352 domain-containing protein [Clostridium perfringens]